MTFPLPWGCAITAWAREALMHHLGSAGGGEVTFSNLGSADDVSPVGHSAQHLEPTRGCFEAKAAQLGLCFSWTRTKAQNLAAGQVMQNIRVNSCSVEGGEECIYLSSEQSSPGRCLLDVP